MKILKEVQEIFDNYELKPIELFGYVDVYKLLRDRPELKPQFETKLTDKFLIGKYKNNIPKGHYGFSIGHSIVPEWVEVIDKIVTLCIKNDPEFEIHQIKLKFGFICFYTLSDVIEDLFDIEILIMNKLHDRALIF